MIGDSFEKLYTLLFSHPSVEAITWWDFMDGGWQGAPAGLVRADLTPKPACERLLKLAGNRWWTKTLGDTDANGECRLRGFPGTCRETAVTPQGYKADEFVLPGETKSVDGNPAQPAAGDEWRNEKLYGRAGCLLMS